MQRMHDKSKTKLSILTNSKQTQGHPPLLMAVKVEVAYRNSKYIEIFLKWNFVTYEIKPQTVYRIFFVVFVY